MVGDGKLGLLVSAVLRLTGADLTLVGRHPEKLAIAQGWGVDVWPTTRVSGEGETWVGGEGETQGRRRGGDVELRCAGAAQRGRGGRVHREPRLGLQGRGGCCDRGGRWC